jgi:hypothetical protein
MRLKAARSAGALYLLSPVAVPGLTLKTRGGAHYYNDFSQSSQRAREKTPRGQVVLRVRGSTGSFGRLTLQRNCGVSWRYQALALKIPRRRGCLPVATSSDNMACKVNSWL